MFKINHCIGIFCRLYVFIRFKHFVLKCICKCKMYICQNLTIKRYMNVKIHRFYNMTLVFHEL